MERFPLIMIGSLGQFPQNYLIVNSRKLYVVNCEDTKNPILTPQHVFGIISSLIHL